ncbi:DNA cytosine methyltransferase (plasmid) [Bermanella marisrubri]|nr:DNA cytosine methyltransferase [Bermanella marisrubri]QIZ85932.1 DNA cytosine methyltransferase [Bermanella marisrubri]
MIMQVLYSKVSESKANKRIWIEGGRLSKAGFDYGEAYTVTYDLENQEIKLELDLFGDRRVSGRKRRGEEKKTPIIDLCSTRITDIVGDSERVRIAIEFGVITVSLHHECRKKIVREYRYRANRSKRRFTTGTLCSGAGISSSSISDGLLSAGFTSKTKWFVDVNLRYLEVADRNNYTVDDETNLIVASIEELENDDLEPVDILNVSLPCDIHAKCGKSKKRIGIAEEDHSITAIVGFLKAIHSVNPSIIVSENVVEAKNSASYLILKSELKRLQYNIHEFILDKEVGGSIEQRKRYWFVATSCGLANPFSDALDHYQRKYFSVGECLEDGKHISDMFKTFDYLEKKEKSDIEKGKGFRQQLVDGNSNSIGTIGKHYAKARSTEPRLIGSNGLSRLFTVVEACRFKLIPEKLVDGCLFTLGHEIQGQSILYGHGWSLGRFISNFR